MQNTEVLSISEKADPKDAFGGVKSAPSATRGLVSARLRKALIRHASSERMLLRRHIGIEFDRCRACDSTGVARCREIVAGTIQASQQIPWQFSIDW